MNYCAKKNSYFQSEWFLTTWGSCALPAMFVRINSVQRDWVTQASTCSLFFFFNCTVFINFSTWLKPWEYILVHVYRARILPLVSDTNMAQQSAVDR